MTQLGQRARRLPVTPDGLGHGLQRQRQRHAGLRIESAGQRPHPVGAVLGQEELTTLGLLLCGVVHHRHLDALGSQHIVVLGIDERRPAGHVAGERGLGEVGGHGRREGLELGHRRPAVRLGPRGRGQQAHVGQPDPAMGSSRGHHRQVAQVTAGVHPGSRRRGVLVRTRRHPRRPRPRTVEGPGAAGLEAGRPGRAHRGQALDAGAEEHQLLAQGMVRWAGSREQELSHLVDRLRQDRQGRPGRQRGRGHRAPPRDGRPHRGPHGISVGDRSPLHPTAGCATCLNTVAGTPTPATTPRGSLRKITPPSGCVGYPRTRGGHHTRRSITRGCPDEGSPEPEDLRRPRPKTQDPRPKTQSIERMYECYHASRSRQPHPTRPPPRAPRGGAA